MRLKLHCKLVELRQQTPQIDNATTATTTTVQNYQPHGIEPKKLFTSNNIEAYAPWEHGIKEKLYTNTVMYTNNQKRISYIF